MESINEQGEENKLPINLADRAHAKALEAVKDMPDISLRNKVDRYCKVISLLYAELNQAIEDRTGELGGYDYWDMSEDEREIEHLICDLEDECGDIERRLPPSSI